MAGGPTHHVPSVITIQKQYPNAKWVGVDRGVFLLLKAGIIPVKAFGDFDSLSDDERRWVDDKEMELSVYPCEKDETDMEIGLNWVLKQKPDQVILLGATGGRLDHLFMNAHLILLGVRKGISIYIQDRWNKFTIWGPGTYRVNRSSYSYVSLIPLTNEVIGLTLKGFRYPLDNATIKQGSSLSLSNEIIEEYGIISFSQGQVYAFESVDERNHKE